MDINKNSEVLNIIFSKQEDRNAMQLEHSRLTKIIYYYYKDVLWPMVENEEWCLDLRLYSGFYPSHLEQEAFGLCDKYSSERNRRYIKTQEVLQSRAVHMILFLWMMANRFGQFVMGVIKISFQPVFLNNAWSVKEKGKQVRCWLHLFRKKTGEEIMWSAKEEKAHNEPPLSK